MCISMGTATATRTRTCGKRIETEKTISKPHMAAGRRLGSGKEQNISSEAAPRATLPSHIQMSMPKNRPRISKTRGSSNHHSATAHKGSDPSSSNSSGLRSDSRGTSSDMSGDLSTTESREQERRSDAPSPDASHTIINSKASSLHDQTSSQSSSRWIRRRRVPKKLNLSFVPKAQLNAVAYREGSKPPESRRNQFPNQVFGDPFTSIPSPQENPIIRRNPKRPSPKSLREARIKRFSPIGLMKSDYSPRGPRPALPHTSYVQTSGNSRPSAGIAFGGGGHPLPTRRKRANIDVRVANIPISEITKYARAGHVVDIVSSFIARQLPMSKRSKALVKKYMQWGQAQLTTQIMGPQQTDNVEFGDTWQQWAYISRLNMADIGRNGRRRTLTHLHESLEEESWTVLLVPLSGRHADGLRKGLATRQADNTEATTRRRQSLGSEVVGSIKGKWWPLFDNVR